jgi:hypothetical protein
VRTPAGVLVVMETDIEAIAVNRTAMKKLLISILIVLLLLIVVLVLQNHPCSSDPKDLSRLSDTTKIKRDLAAIVNTPRSRNFKNPEILDNVAGYVRSEFLKSTDRVTEQAFDVRSQSYRNIIASFGPQDGERIVVGAHYDVCGDQDGADDNASGVAGLLGLARLLKKESLKYRIDLVAYTLEEPPFFAREEMGSYIHAKSLHDAKIPVKGMISLEMIGFYSDEENSQRYPLGFLKWFYGNKGNFITIIQNSMAGSFSRNFKKLAFKNNSILTKSFQAPSFFGGIDLSDHRNYWKFGYSALMITNTSFYRNQNYHTKGDVLSKLNVPNIGLVVDGVFRTLTQME